jgi:hypothetical protein
MLVLLLQSSLFLFSFSLFFVINFFFYLISFIINCSIIKLKKMLVENKLT